MEVWKQIDGYENYEVSNLGRVRSLPKKTRKGIRVLKPIKQSYLTVDLCKDGVVKKHLIHRIVAKEFISNPEMKQEVNHKDGNKHNNSIDNLEWVTRCENRKHAFDIGLQSAKGSKNSQSKLNESQVLEIFKSNLRGFELSKLYNISPGTICDIKKRRSWKHLSL